MDWLNEFADKLLQFAALPVGGAILVLVLIGLVLIALIIWGSIRLRGKQLEFSEARNRREAELEQAKLKSEENEDIRRSATNASIAAAIKELVNGRHEDRQNQTRIITILERMEARDASNNDTLRDVKDNTDALVVRTTNIHKDIRSSAVTLAGKLDGANSESRTRWENTQIVLNNRAQEIQKTVHSTANDITGKLTEQNSVLDQMLNKLGELSKEVTGLRSDFRDNTTSQAAALAHREDERFMSIQNSLRELAAGLLALKKHGTGPLDPSSLPPTVDAVINTKTFAEPPIGHIPKKQTEPLPPLEEPRLTPPAVHDTAQFSVVHPAKDKPDAT